MFNYKKSILLSSLIVFINYAYAQDSLPPKLNMDALYNRPFLTIKKVPIAIGGYIEANTQYDNIDGVASGWGFQMRRMTLFFSSTVAKKIRFLSEIEFENGTQEINIETAVADIEFHPLLVLRTGILLNPIGAFNQNHDGPRWDFVDRPLVSTEIVPSTLSNVGMGLYGKYYKKNWILGYEAYLTNGFDDNLIENDMGRTSFHAAKSNPNKFESSYSGSPLFSTKVAVRNRKYGELGLSYLTGIYNQWLVEGTQVDDKRRAVMMALDFTTSVFKNSIAITGEIVKARIALPTNYIQTYGTRQLGGYCDVTFTALQKSVLGWANARVLLGVRLEYVDYNQDKFRITHAKIFDEVYAITPTISFRPTGSAVLRLNYQHRHTVDLLGNPPSVQRSIQVGLSTYF